MSKLTAKTTVLLIAALLVWGFTVVRIVGSLRTREEVLAQAPQESPQKALSLLPTVSAYKTTARDPFEPYIKVFKPRKRRRATATPTKRASPAAKDTIPAFVLNGIMWDEKSPVAVIGLPDGNTQLVSPGQVVEGVKVVSITRSDVTLSKGRKKWTIK